MDTNEKITKKIDTKVLLSTLWIIASIITIVFVVGGDASYPHYIFIATVEVICLLLIIWNTWKWSEQKEGAR